jgi:hypothetical protein
VRWISSEINLKLTLYPRTSMLTNGWNCYPNAACRKMPAAKIHHPQTGMVPPAGALKIEAKTEGSSETGAEVVVNTRANHMANMTSSSTALTTGGAIVHPGEAVDTEAGATINDPTPVSNPTTLPMRSTGLFKPFAQAKHHVIN